MWVGETRYNAMKVSGYITVGSEGLRGISAKATCSLEMRGQTAKRANAARAR